MKTTLLFHDALHGLTLSTSVPRLIPPSTKTGTRPPTALTTPGRASAVDIHVSSWRPPWFEQTIPWTPALTASSASSGETTPYKTLVQLTIGFDYHSIHSTAVLSIRLTFTQIGKDVIVLSQSKVFQVADASISLANSSMSSSCERNCRFAVGSDG